MARLQCLFYCFIGYTTATLQKFCHPLSSGFGFTDAGEPDAGEPGAGEPGPMEAVLHFMSNRKFMIDLRRYEHFVLPLSLCLLGLVIILRLPLQESLWLDEAISAWIVQGSFREVVDRSLAYQGQSPFYFVLLWAVVQGLGSDEFVLRLPSLLFSCISLFVVAILAKQLCGSLAASCKTAPSVAALCAAALLLLTDGFLVAAVSARPYAMALCFSLLATSLFLRVMEKESLLNAALYVACMWCTFYAHYLFAGVIGLHALWFLVARFENGPAASAKTLSGVLVLFLLGAWQGMLHLFDLFGRREMLSFAVRPDVADLAAAILPAPIVVYLIFALLLVRIYVPFRCTFGCVPSRVWLFSGAWWLLPPLFFAGISLVASASLFVPRLFLWSAPGLALVCAVLLCTVTPPKARRWILVAVIGFAFFRESARIWHVEGWREAVHRAQERNPKGDMPVLLYTGLIEADSREWLENRAHTPYLGAPLQYYPIRNEVLLLPRTTLSGRSKAYTRELLKEAARKEDSLLLIAAIKRFAAYSEHNVTQEGRKIVPYVHLQLIEALQSLGYHTAYSFKAGEVVLFQMERAEN